MKKKIISLCLVAALALTAIGGATLAYFTDDDQKTNNFTIGNISIQVEENDGRGCYVYDPVAGKIVEDAAQTQYDEYGNETGVTFNDLMPSYIISKRPYVQNTSDTAAWVRVAVTLNNTYEINKAIDQHYEPILEKQFRDENPEISKDELDAKVDAEVQKIYDEVFYGWGLNHYHEGSDGKGRRMTMNQRTGDVCIQVDSAFLMKIGDYQFNRSNLFQSALESEDANHDGTVEANNEDCYYYEALNGNDRVYVFYLYLEAGQKYFLFDQAGGSQNGGLNIPAEFNNDQMEMFQEMTIGIYADAIQAVGFKRNMEGAKAAFGALQKEHAIGWWNE